MLDPSDPFADDDKERREVEELARKFESKYVSAGLKPLRKPDLVICCAVVLETTMNLLGWGIIEVEGVKMWLNDFACSLFLHYHSVCRAVPQKRRKKTGFRTLLTLALAMMRVTHL